MKLSTLSSLALTVAPALAIPPEDFGFPSAPNDTALTVAFRQTNGTYITVQEGDLFGISIPAEQPIVAVNTSEYQSLSNYSGNYLVCMVDPDASYPENPTSRFILHWLAPNMTQSDQAGNSTTEAVLQGGRELVNSSVNVVPYRRPSPPTNSSAHRYILYAFQQPANFSIPAAWSGLSDANRTRFNLTEFINQTNLGIPAAANYYYVSNETNVTQNFSGNPGTTYPGGNGDAVTSGDPYSASATATAGSGGSASSSGAAAVITGMGGMIGAGLIGLAALM